MTKRAPKRKMTDAVRNWDRWYDHQRAQKETDDRARAEAEMTRPARVRGKLRYPRYQRRTYPRVTEYINIFGDVRRFKQGQEVDGVSPNGHSVKVPFNPSAIGSSPMLMPRPEIDYQKRTKPIAGHREWCCKHDGNPGLCSCDYGSTIGGHLRRMLQSLARA